MLIPTATRDSALLYIIIILKVDPYKISIDLPTQGIEELVCFISQPFYNVACTPPCKLSLRDQVALLVHYIRV
jgi:hypothetical protein